MGIVQPRPLWEDIHPRDIHDLIGLIADEAWRRTREPAVAATMAELTAACRREQGSWSSCDRLESEAYARGMERGEQAALIGFYLAVILRDTPEHLSVDEACARAMSLAGLTPLSAHDEQQPPADQSPRGKED
jgi:hypothetical protein